jgi:cation transporter-like permease
MASLPSQSKSHPAAGFAVAVPLLKLAGVALGGWLQARAAAAAAAQLARGSADQEYLRGRLQSAAFYAAHVLPQSAALAEIAGHGAASVLDAEPELL